MFYQLLPVTFSFVADNPGTDYSVTLDLTQTLLAFAQSNVNAGFIGQNILPDAITLTAVNSENSGNLMSFTNCSAALSSNKQRVTISSTAGFPFEANTSFEFTLKFNITS